ncbi:MAG: glycosyltransferase family 2 protein [Cyanobacteriota bacterium]
MVVVNHSDPLISVIIPTYNGGDWLLVAIASALEQGPIRPELIVVDDASTDHTPERVAAAFPQVRLLRQSVNSGSGAHGRNIGLQAATGSYVKFLDHDDLLQPGALALELQAAEQHQADMVMARWGDVKVDAQGRLIEASRRVFIPPAPERLIEAILLGEKVPYTAGVLYRRSFIAEQRWDARLTINDDFDWFCRNALRTDRIVRLDHVSYFWRLHASSIQGSQRSNPLSFVESVYIQNHVYRGIAIALQEQQRLSPSFRRLLARQLFRDLRVLARFNPARCWQTLRWILTLQPGFQPDATLEPSRWLRRLSALLGIKTSLQLYRWLLFVPDQLRFRGGSIRFFEA